jgi:hypothetical protein
MAEAVKKREKRSFKIKDIQKEVRRRVGLGLDKEFIDEAVKETVKVMMEMLLKGKNVIVGKGLRLKANVVSEYGEREVERNGEKKIVKIVPSIKIVSNRIKAKNGENIEQLKEQVLEKVEMV